MAEKKPNKIVEDATKDFRAAYGKIADDLIEEININIDSGMSTRMAVNKAVEDTNYINRLRTATLEPIPIIFTSVSGVKYNPVKTRKTWLRRHYDKNALTLSKTIAKQNFKSQIANEIVSLMQGAGNWKKLAKNITDKDLVSGKIAKHMRELVKASKRARSHADDIVLNRKYAQAVKRSQRQIEKLYASGARGKRLAKAYDNLLKQTLKGADNAIEKGIERAVKAKARYNAERIARTEYSRAYGQAETNRQLDDPDVIGVRYTLSSAHVVYDICDFHTGVDQYGMGAGVYPKKLSPPYPFHPHCRCRISDVIVGDATPKRRDKSAAIRWLNKQTPEHKKALMNRKKLELYEKNNKSWEKGLNNYNGIKKRVKMKVKNLEE